VSSRESTGYALGLGCLHRYVGSMGAGQHMTSSVSILFALAQNSSSPILQVWAIHALYLIIDSGGSMFRNYIEPCVEFIVQSVLNIQHTNRDVYVALGKLLNALITFVGPELQINAPSSNDIRAACLITCDVLLKHTDSLIKCEAIQCYQQLNLFAPKYIELDQLVPALLSSLVSKEFVVRKVTVSCLRQLCQKNSADVCRLARAYVNQTKPVGLLSLIGDQCGSGGLEYLLFKMLDIETNLFIIRDIHDILNSLISTQLNEYSLKHWLYLCRDIAVSSDSMLAGSAINSASTNSTVAADSSFASRKKPGANKSNLSKLNSDQDNEMDTTDRSNAISNRDEQEEEEIDDSQSFQMASVRSPEDYVMGSISSSSSGAIGNDQAILNSTIKLRQITKLISPKWPNRVFAIELIRYIIEKFAALALADSYEGESANIYSSTNSDSSSTGCSTSDEMNKSFSYLFNAKKVKCMQTGHNGADSLKRLAHFDLLLAKKYDKEQQNRQKKQTTISANSSLDEDQVRFFLILFLPDLMPIACRAATCSSDQLKLAGLDLLNDIVIYFAHVEEPNPEFKDHVILEQYQAQVSAALRPQFSIETSAHVTAKACQVCSIWISSGVARDLNDLRRVHQLLVSSLQKLTNNSLAGNGSNNFVSMVSSAQHEQSQLQQTASITTANSDHLIYSELSLTVEKLAVLRAWAEVYIIAHRQMLINEKNSSAGSESLLSLVKPELALLSHHWSIALKDFAYLSLPNGKF
jgi:hypothetical protein